MGALRKSLMVISVLLIQLLAMVCAQTTNPYDALLTGTQWYVPDSSLLGYDSFGSFSSKIPASSQNVFNITSCTNGDLIGTNNITTVLGNYPPTHTWSTFTGQVSPSGGLTIQMFTAGSSRLMYWEGQILTLASGQLQLQIQMMSAGGGLYFNHWMNMNQSTADTVLPANSVGVEMTYYNNQSANYKWLVGTNWTFHYTPLFPASQTTKLLVDGFFNGYFWGVGLSTLPNHTLVSNFTFFASVVPEGRLLIEILQDQAQLTVFWGNVTYSIDDDTEMVESGYMGMRNCSITAVVGPYAYATLDAVADSNDGGEDDDVDSDIALGVGLGLGMPLVAGGLFAAYYYLSSGATAAKKPMAQQPAHSVDII